MGKYRVYSIRELRQVATYQEMLRIDQELLKKVRGD